MDSSNCYINPILRASLSCPGISNMKMLIFPQHCAFFIIFIISLQVPSPLLSYSALTSQTVPGSWGSWSSWTRGRSCESGSCVGEDTQTSDKTCPYFEALKTKEAIGSAVVHFQTIIGEDHGYFGSANDEWFMNLVISQL